MSIFGKSAIQTQSVTIQVAAKDAAEAQQVGQCLANMSGYFTPAELLKIADKLKSPINRQKIKTFL